MHVDNLLSLTHFFDWKGNAVILCCPELLSLYIPSTYLTVFLMLSLPWAILCPLFVTYLFIVNRTSSGTNQKVFPM